MDILFLTLHERDWEYRLSIAESILEQPITVIHGEDTILKSFIKCFTESKTQSFILIDGDNILLPEAKDILLTHDGSPTIFNAKNKYGMDYPHGAIKILTKDMLLNPIFTQNDILDVTTKLNLKHDSRTLSIHNFDFSEFNEWKTIYKELVKLHFTYANNSSTRLTLDSWTKNDYVNNIYEQVKNDIKTDAKLSTIHSFSTNTILKNKFLKNKKIILGAICKNENLYVDRFVKYASAFDGCVVLDTGSTDDTYEKFLKNNIMIFKETFDRIDFSEFRNSLYAKINDCVPEYDAIFYLDLDEILILEDVTLLKEELFINSELTKRFNITRIEHDKNNYTQQFRIFKRSGGKWFYKLHEDFIYDDKDVSYMDLSVTTILLEHDNLKSVDFTKEKSQKYLEIILDLVETDPRHYLYFLFLHYVQNHEYDSIIESYRKYVDVLDEHDFGKFKELIYSHILKAQMTLGYILDEKLIEYLYNQKNKSAHVRLIYFMINHVSIDYLERAKEIFKEFISLPEKTKNENYLSAAYNNDVIFRIKEKLSINI